MDSEDEAVGRVARLMDYVDQEDIESDHDLPVLLEALKIRNGLYLRELNTLYQAYSQPSGTPKDLDLEDFFSTEKKSIQDPKHVMEFKSTVPNSQKPKPVKTDHEFSITVPQPFQMTLREAQRKDKTKTLTFTPPEDLQNDEDPECLKKFRAQPAPAHVFLPLYSELVEQCEARRTEHVQKRKEFLLSTQKPFRFIEKEEEKKKKAGEMFMSFTPAKEQNIKKNIPKSVLDPTISDKLKEADLFRKINSQMRAKEMLQNSSAPITLTRGTRDSRSSTSMKTQQERLGFLQQNLTFRPRTNASVPDFERLYKMFLKQSTRNQKVKEPTRSNPFTLHTSNLRERKRQSPEDNVKAGPCVAVAPSRNASVASLSSLSSNTLPVYITDSTKMRESAIRSSLEEKSIQEIQKAERTIKHKKKTRSMQRSISRKAKALDPHRPLSDTSEQKLNQIRQSDLRRMKEYRQELEEMKRRVHKRPFLFEHVTKGSAVKEAERRYRNTLQEAGLTEEFVQHKGHDNETNQGKEEEAWEED